MNEEFLKRIWEEKGFSEKGSFEEFSEIMKTPEMQKRVYDTHFADKGSFEEFQATIGTSPQEAKPIQEPIAEEQGEKEIDLSAVTFPTFGGIVNLGFLKDTRFGDFVEDMIRAGTRGVATGAGVGESLEVLVKAGNATDEDLTDLVEVVERQQKYGVSDEFREFIEAEGFKESTKAFLKNPITIIAETVVESAAAMARSGGVAIAGSAATGPAAAVLTPIALGATSAALETSGKMVESMQEYLAERGMEFNEENIRKIFADEKAWAEMRNKAIGKGAVIGLVDGATAGLVTKMGGSGLVSKMAKAAKKGKKVSPRAAKLGTTAKQAAVETASGSVGELAGQLAIGEELDLKGAALEAIAEIPGAGASIGASLVVNQKRLGKLTDEQMAQAVQDNSQEDFDATVDVAQQLGQIDEVQAQELKESFDDLASINETIPDTVSDKRKRSKIVGLIRERKLVERDLDEVKSEEVDPSFQEEKQQEIDDLEDDVEAINEEIETVKNAKETGPLREEGLPQEGGEERVGDLQGEPQTQTEAQQTEEEALSSPELATQALSLRDDRGRVPKDNRKEFNRIMGELRKRGEDVDNLQDIANRQENPFQFIDDEAILGQDVELSVTNAETGKPETVTMTMQEAQQNVQTELDKINRLRDCL